MEKGNGGEKILTMQWSRKKKRTNFRRKGELVAYSAIQGTVMWSNRTGEASGLKAGVGE